MRKRIIAIGLIICMLLGMWMLPEKEAKAYYVEGSTIKMLAGETYTITPEQEVTSWKSSMPGVVSVDQSGKLTAIVYDYNAATITGTHADGTKETYQAKVMKPICTLETIENGILR